MEDVSLDPDLLPRLADALRACSYAYDDVAGVLGPTAHDALGRNETTPGLRATRGGSRLETLTRLWPLQAPVPRGDLEAALPGLVDPLVAAGVLARSGEDVRAAVDVRPYAAEDRDWWVVSDLTPGLDGAPNRVDGDHVLGVSSASTSLAQLTVRRPVGSALDLGTGCGVQSLHLADHAGTVVATDVNRRALALARATAGLNGVDLDVRDGSLWEPVAGERFDLVVTNPPFVVSPPGGARLVYRDSGLPGDEVVRRVVSGCADHLAPGGVAQVLANWVHVDGEPWQERVASWLPEGCDAWVVQRELADPAEYVELWLRDAGAHHDPDYTERYDAWLGWFEEQRVAGVGFGWLVVRRPDGATRPPVVRLEEWGHAVEQPLGPEVAAWLERAEVLARPDRDLLTTTWRRRADVVEETYGEPGSGDPETIVLRQQRGMRRARRADTLTAGFVGACDGELPFDRILAALAQLLERPAEEVVAAALPELRGLVEDGFLEV